MITTNKRFLITMLFSMIFYTTVCCLFMHFFAPKKVEDCPKCMQAIAQYKAALIARSNPDYANYNESLYNQGGGINPGFRDIVSERTSSAKEPKTRAYEQQLAEYNKIMAEKQRIRKEEELREAQEAARERALMEQERMERLRQEEELKKAAAISTKGDIGPSKTFTPRSTKQPSRPQTQIGTLRTSKLGESSFQK